MVATHAVPDRDTAVMPARLRDAVAVRVEAVALRHEAALTRASVAALRDEVRETCAAALRMTARRAAAVPGEPAVERPARLSGHAPASDLGTGEPIAADPIVAVPVRPRPDPLGTARPGDAGPWESTAARPGDASAVRMVDGADLDAFVDDLIAAYRAADARDDLDARRRYALILTQVGRCLAHGLGPRAAGLTLN